MSRKKRKRRLVRALPTLLLSASMRYRFVSCELDVRLYQLHRDGAPVAVEPKVFDVLLYLLQHRDQVVSKDELLDKVWPGQVVSETTLSRCIAAARKAVGDDGIKQAVIETQHGRGFRFIATVTEQKEAPPVALSTNGTGAMSVLHNGPSSESLVSLPPIPGGHEVNEHAVSVESSKFQVQGSKVEDSASQKAEKVVSRQFSVVSPNPLDRRTGGAHRKWLTISATGLLLIVGAIVTARYLSRSPLITHYSSPVTEEAKPPPLPLPDKPSIIVLPFTNLSGDPGQEYFSDGLTDGLITELSRIPQLFVIARHSAFTYKGKQVKVQDIGREMGVQYVLEGSVQRIEGRLRILAQLSDTMTGEQLWAERYDLELNDTIPVQETIRQKIAALRTAALK